MIGGKFWRDVRGNMAMLFAMGFAVSAMLGAVGIDAASLYHERRTLQNGVDLAAIAAATDPAKAKALAQATLVDAGLLDSGSETGLGVVVGRYDPDPAVAPEARFVVNGTPTNAVRVSLTRPGTLYFARSWAPQPELGAQALATLTPQVAFSVGSRLASLNGGIANSVLNALLGSSASLSVMDYNGLVGANVDLFGFLDALAQELHITAGTYGDLLKANATHGQIAAALARTLTGSAKGAAQGIAAVTGHNGTLPVGRLFQLGALGDLKIGSGADAALFTAISALDLMAASAALGNGSHQVGLSVSAGVPGLVGIDSVLAVGEPPQGGTWYGIGPTGTVVRTAQTRLNLVATVLGSGALVGLPIRLPLYLELAQSEAVVSAATCPAPSSPKGSAVIRVKPGALRLRIGEVDPTALSNFAQDPVVGLAKLLEVKLLGIPILQVLASSLVEIAQTNPQALPFTSADIAAGTIRSANVSTPIASLTTSLIDNLKLEAPILGLGLNLTSLRVLLRTILLPVAPTLDMTITRLFSAVGLKTGEADVVVYGVRCTQPVLVG